MARLKLSLGADFGRTLVYGVIGAARAEVSAGGSDLSDNGYLGGVGVAYRLREQFIVGAELLSHRFDDFDSTGIDPIATTFTVRASFKF